MYVVSNETNPLSLYSRVSESFAPAAYSLCSGIDWTVLDPKSNDAIMTSPSNMGNIFNR